MKFKFSTIAKRGTGLILITGAKIEINYKKVVSGSKKITPAVKNLADFVFLRITLILLIFTFWIFFDLIIRGDISGFCLSQDYADFTDFTFRFYKGLREIKANLSAYISPNY
ncbi:hypothetical protein [Chitinophaga sp. ARDCPP14]|uniref:hypothetical protein n=1 Tax=Chitinophaga sp. ARDCPP14 TaxID=3391139 RepID=UPI003F51BD11